MVPYLLTIVTILGITNTPSFLLLFSSSVTAELVFDPDDPAPLVRCNYLVSPRHIVEGAYAFVLGRIEEKVGNGNHAKLNNDKGHNLDNKDCRVKDVVYFLERFSVSSQFGLLVQLGGHDAYLSIDAAVWLMDHVIIGEEGLSEHPEVVLVGQPIIHAQLGCVFELGVDEHIVTIEGDPIVLDHDLYVSWPCAAARIEYAIALFVLHT